MAENMTNCRDWHCKKKRRAVATRLSHMLKVSKAVLDQTIGSRQKLSTAMFDLVQCNTPLSRIKGDQRFCQISLWRAKVPLLTFDSRPRPNIFNARQSCVKVKVKVNVKSTPTALIRLSKIAVPLCYTFANHR